MPIATPIELQKDGGLTENGVTSDPFTPGTDTLIVVSASCYGATGDSAGDLSITDSLGGIGWTPIVKRCRADDGGAAAPPPAVMWMAEGTGLEMTVTTSKLNVTGYSHVQGVTGITGHDEADPVAATGEQTTNTNGSLTLATPDDDCLLLFHSVDINSTTIVPTADANTTTRYADARLDEIQSTFIGQRAVGAAGNYTIGTATPASGTNINAVAVAIRPGAAAPSEVTLTPATLTLAVQPFSPVPGPVAVDFVPVALALSVQPLSPVPGPVAVTLTPVVLTLAVVPLSLPDVVPVPGRLTPSVAGSNLSARSTGPAYTTGSQGSLTATTSP